MPLAIGGLLLGAPAAQADPEFTGNITRGSGANDLIVTLTNSGTQGFQYVRLTLGQDDVQMTGVALTSGPTGGQCDQDTAGQIFCNFSPSPFPPNTDVVINATTQTLFPDNHGGIGRGCPNPCPPSTDVGPFTISGPAPTTTPPSGGITVPPGFDLFETDPEQTIFDFNGPTAIPAGFFGPGSDPFTGQVHFGGVPINDFQNMDVGDTDTVVQRAGATVPASGPSNPIPIELVSLSLRSIEPISVNMQGGADSFFDVFVELSLTQRSMGQMAITGDAAGGTFVSSLDVVPRFQFVPVGGGEARVLDVGALPPDPERDQALHLVQEGGVWQPGCAPPALLVPGLNDAFCPGLTTDNEKQLTVEQSALARHGVYPAQPRLEHFACYSVRGRKFKPFAVQLADQFGAAGAKVIRHAELCNPAQKNGERFVNEDAHLECYAITRTARPRLVAILNQFGSTRLTTTRAHRLCVPSLKFRKAPAQRQVTFTDHFQCYGVKRSKFAARNVKVRDQFGFSSTRVLRPVRLCNPVQKNAGRIEHPTHHLVCYAIRRKTKFRRQKVIVRNQFGRNQPIVAKRPRTLCVPSAKVLIK